MGSSPNLYTYTRNPHSLFTWSSRGVCGFQFEQPRDCYTCSYAYKRECSCQSNDFKGQDMFLEEKALILYPIQIENNFCWDRTQQIHGLWVELSTNEPFDLLKSGHKIIIYQIPMFLFTYQQIVAHECLRWIKSLLIKLFWQERCIKIAPTLICYKLHIHSRKFYTTYWTPEWHSFQWILILMRYRLTPLPSRVFKIMSSL